MELHQLEYVIALEQYRSFSVTADQINISQPTLSHQIKKLEDELGIKLFLRTTRSVQLTTAGQEFLIYAKRTLAEVEKAKNAMLEHLNLKKGNIKIGAIFPISIFGITSAIVSFQKMYPDINLELYEANSDNLIKKMQSSEVDIAFITSPYVSGYEFDFYPLINDKLVFLISSSHKLANRKTVHLSEFSGEKFLLLRTTTSIQNNIIQLFHQSGFKPNIILRSGHAETIRPFIEEGIGVALLSYHVALSILSPKSTIVELATPIKRITGLAIPKNNDLLVTNLFKDYILKYFAYKDK